MNIYDKLVINPELGFGFVNGAIKQFTLAFSGENTQLDYSEWMALANAFHKISDDMKEFAYKRFLCVKF
jgi:hypothetical protein